MIRANLIHKLRCLYTWGITHLTALTHKRVRSGVLQLTLGISLIIAAMCGSMIMLVYYARLSFLQETIQDKLRSNSISGIQYMMARRNEVPYNEIQTLDLFHDETDTVRLVRKPWGIFDLLIAYADQGNHHTEKAALLAAEPDSVGMACIYIPGNNAITYLAGKASITGYAYMPVQGLTPGFINGKAFKGDKLIHGKLKKSKPLLPELDTTLIYAIKQVIGKRPSAYTLKDISPDEFKRYYPFTEVETSYYFTEGTVTITDTISGHVIIHSNHKIIIDSTAVINDAIILASDVDIMPGFTGRLQCFATHSISVGKRSVLHFPSALALVGKERDSLIVIHPHAIVEGIVLIPGYDQAIGSRGVLKVEKSAILHGMAYCNGAANIEGSIWGHITLRSFQVTVGESASSNYLMDGEINGEKRSTDFPASLLWGGKQKWVIAKWLK